MHELLAWARSSLPSPLDVLGLLAVVSCKSPAVVYHYSSSLVTSTDPKSSLRLLLRALFGELLPVPVCTLLNISASNFESTFL